MNHRPAKGAFTLVELLVTIAMMGIILSMIYGSCFGISGSVRRFQNRTALREQVRSAGALMSRQIRCAYVGREISEGAVHSTLRGSNVQDKSLLTCFRSSLDDPDGVFLRLVTTSAVTTLQGPGDGLFEVEYRLDDKRGQLFYRQALSANNWNNVLESADWQLLAEKVKSMELAFFDGVQWRYNWDQEKERELPHAVQISIIAEAEGDRACHFETTTEVFCGRSSTR